MPKKSPQKFKYLDESESLTLSYYFSFFSLDALQRQKNKAATTKDQCILSKYDKQVRQICHATT